MKTIRIITFLLVFVTINSYSQDIPYGVNEKAGRYCDGWHFVKSDSLSVIKETMPSMTKEKLHYHKKAQQFFYILSGVAEFEIDGINCTVGQNRGISIKPGVKHRISNNSESNLEFLVISEPQSHEDRVNIDDDE